MARDKWRDKFGKEADPDNLMPRGKSLNCKKKKKKTRQPESAVEMFEMLVIFQVSTKLAFKERFTIHKVSLFFVFNLAFHLFSLLNLSFVQSHLNQD